ncbi:invasion protein IalB [Bradyrhizobium algeriense]|uniref:Invasion protein IalB n=1 Tax=Bradyrhizobium algeriense TaxID=634784 RepID=A0ABU8BAW8_9BRAD
MNFRILAGSIRPRGQIIALLAASALSATLIVSGAQAQQPAPGAPKAPPKAAPKAPAAQAPPAGAPPAGAAPQPQEQQVQLIYAPWTKFCLKGQEAGAKQVCFTGKDGRIESGQPVIAAVIIEPEGEPKKLLRVTLPLGMQLVHGTRIIVDSNAPLQGPYVICFQNGCMSDYEATPELIASLKKGQNLVVQAINSNGAPLTLPLPLAGEFAKAYDGPPTDPKVFEENQKKLQEELQKRAEEQRKKLEGGGAANPAAK